jgi:hypothetical protein
MNHSEYIKTHWVIVWGPYGTCIVGVSWEIIDPTTHYHTPTHADDVWYLHRIPTTPVPPICIPLVWYMCRSKILTTEW